MPTDAITGIRLVKHYGEVTALDGVDLHVERGTVHALLGPTVPARPRWSTC